MKVLAILALTTLPAMLFASTPAAHPWGTDWAPIITENSCRLLRTYKDKIQVSFSIASPTARVHDRAFDVEMLYLFLAPTVGTSDLTPQPRIDSATIHGYRLIKYEVATSKYYAFYLRQDKATAVMDSLSRDEAPNITVHYSNGDVLTTEMPARPKNRFKVWAGMLKACAAANVA